MAEMLDAARMRGLEVVEVVAAGRGVKSAVERARVLAGTGSIDVVLTPTITGLGGLARVAACLAMGLSVTSVREPWVGPNPPLLSITTWLDEQAQLRRSAIARAGIRAARASGQRIGRPRKEIDATRALALIRDLGVSKASLVLGVGRSTLRAWRAANDATARTGREHCEGGTTWSSPRPLAPVVHRGEVH